MIRVRIIPTLLLENGGLVKSTKFKNYNYIGDPINAVKIFNDKEVDEIAILDISATAQKRPPNFLKIQEFTSEAFMPLGYGGGISSIEHMDKLISLGVEKVILNSAAINNPALVEKASKFIGSQSIVISIDVKINWLGQYKVYASNGKQNTGIDPTHFAKQMESAGAGEIILNSIDRDGTYEGYDLKLIEHVSSSVQIPLIALGGAGKIKDFKLAIQAGASAAAAGSLFLYQGPHRAVLISYPSQQDFEEFIYST